MPFGATFSHLVRKINALRTEVSFIGKSTRFRLVTLRQLIHRRLNVRTVLVAVALDHAQVLVATDPLHSG
jgi:hypothetical protein